MEYNKRNKMKTIKKSEIFTLDIVPLKGYLITDRGDGFVMNNEENVRVTTNSDGDFYEVTDSTIWVAAHIIINSFDSLIDQIPYKSDTDALVAYTKAVEQLNNPNVEFISF